MGLANWITTLRIILVPVCVGILFTDIANREMIAAIVFIIAGMTDWLDGFVARAYGEVSDWGKSYDPIADKLLIVLMLAALTFLDLNVDHRVPQAAFWIIVIREIIITILRSFAGKKGMMIAASMWGKAKTFCQIVAIAAMMIGNAVHFPYGIPILWLAVALTVYSGLEYVWRWRGAFSKK